MSQGPRHINTDRSLNRPTEQRPTEASALQYYNEHPQVNEAIRQVEQLQKQQEKKKHRDVAR